MYERGASLYASAILFTNLDIELVLVLFYHSEHVLGQLPGAHEHGGFFFAVEVGINREDTLPHEPLEVIVGKHGCLSTRRASPASLATTRRPLNTARESANRKERTCPTALIVPRSAGCRL